MSKRLSLQDENKIKRGKVRFKRNVLLEIILTAQLVHRHE